MPSNIHAEYGSTRFRTARGPPEASKAGQTASITSVQHATRERDQQATAASRT